ncbi:MAG: ATP-binding cassette domain-containing protein [Gammaproteobacteria bacterium]|nr:ATP-binding cassette domain-containing protein [Gammaproteobacteria bacterium]
MITLSHAGLIRSGRSVLQDIDLELTTGNLICLCGPNGAGKSSLIGLCAGDLAPTTGTVRLRDVAPATCPPDELALLRAVMPQSPALEHPFAVADVVALGAPATPMDAREKVLEELGCSALLTRIYTELSGGERRLVQLARVLLQAERAAHQGHRPWLLLDEPVNQLDLGRCHQVMTALEQRAAEGLGVITVMHDIELASRHAERLLVLAHGRVIADGDPVAALREGILEEAWEIEAEVEAESPGPGIRVRVIQSSRGPSAAG